MLGRIILLIDRRRCAIADENLRRCLPELSDAEHSHLLKRNFEHYGIIALELMHVFTPVPGHYKRYARSISVLEGYENWKKAHDKGKGVLFASCHSGSWEMLVAQGGLCGMELTMVTRRLQPDWFHERIKAMRLTMEVKAAYQPRTLPTVLKALRNNESVGFVIDQYAAPDAGGVPVRFFGFEVNTLGAIGPIANKTGAAIIPGHAYRDEDGIVHVVLEPEMPLGDLETSTQRIADKVESWIRAHPDQWLWGHRRFKHADMDDRQPRLPEGVNLPA